MAYISERNYINIGSTSNLGQNLNDEVEFENEGGFSSIGIHVTAQQEVKQLLKLRLMVRTGKT